MMNSAQSKENALLRASDNHGASLWDIAIVIGTYKRIIFGLPVFVGVAAAAVSFALPEVYRARTTLMPPQQSQSTVSTLLSQLGGISSMAGGALKNPSDLYVGMLKSEHIANKLIARYQLKSVYGTDSLERARSFLDSNTAINSSKDGMISVEVEDRNKRLVAQLANAYVDELLKLTRVLAVTEASQRRLFFERQLEAAKNNLAHAESSLKSSLEAKGIASVDSDTNAIIATSARLRAQEASAEIRLNSLKEFVTSENAEYRRAEQDVLSLRQQLSKLENGSSVGQASGKSSAVAGGLDNVKMMRDVKYYQFLYELLAKQYEAARIDEARDPAVIQVLDQATEPERNIKPRRAIIVALSALVAFLCSVAGALLHSNLQRVRSTPETGKKWNELVNSWRIR